MPLIDSVNSVVPKSRIPPVAHILHWNGIGCNPKCLRIASPHTRVTVKTMNSTDE
jgi:hypothetical protein